MNDMFRSIHSVLVSLVALSDVNSDTQNSSVTFDERLAAVNNAVGTVQRLFAEYKTHQV